MENKSVSAPQSPGEIADLVSAYIGEHPAAVVVEDGKMLFDFAPARHVTFVSA